MTGREQIRAGLFNLQRRIYLISQPFASNYLKLVFQAIFWPMIAI